MATIFIVSCSCLGKVLEPDRVISISSMEHRESNTSKPYEVRARTLGSEPVLSYELGCGTGAAYLDVGAHYKAAEVYSKDRGKELVIFGVTPDADSKNIIGIVCDVEFVGASGDSKR